MCDTHACVDTPSMAWFLILILMASSNLFAFYFHKFISLEACLCLKFLIISNIIAKLIFKFLNGIEMPYSMLFSLGLTLVSKKSFLQCDSTVFSLGQKFTDLIKNIFCHTFQSIKTCKIQVWIHKYL